MDDVFKHAFTTSAYSTLPKLMRDWKEQIKYIDSVWDKIEIIFDRRLCYRIFFAECRELALPSLTYDIERALKQAKTIWRVELMIVVVEKILHTYIDDINLTTTGFVEWHKHDKTFSINIERVINERESNNYYRKQCLERSLQQVNNYLKLDGKCKASVISNTTQAIVESNDASDQNPVKYMLEHIAKIKVDENN